MQLARYHFRSQMRFIHGLVRELGLADDVAHGEDVRHVGSHVDVDVEETTAYGLQDQVVYLRAGAATRALLPAPPSSQMGDSNFF